MKSLKTYTYVNRTLLASLDSQLTKGFLSKLRLSIRLNLFEASVDSEKRVEIDHDRIVRICNHFANGAIEFREPGDHFTHESYFSREKLNLRKIEIDVSSMESQSRKKSITLWVSEERTFSSFKTPSPLILISDETSSNIDRMDGSSGYSIFRKIFIDYLRCSENFLSLVDSSTRQNFELHPVQFFQDFGIFVSDSQSLEVLYQKRSTIIGEDSTRVFTFAYPVYLAKSV